MALGDGERGPLVAEPRRPTPAGQRLLDTEEGRSWRAGFGRHAATIAQAAVDITHRTRSTAILRRRTLAPPNCRVSGRLSTSNCTLWRMPGQSLRLVEASIGRGRHARTASIHASPDSVT